MKRGLITICLMLFLFPLTVAAQTAGYVLEFNGTKMVSDVTPQTVQGQLFIPLRPIVEALEGTIEYEPSSRMVTVWRTGFQLQFCVGENVADYAGDNLLLSNKTWIHQGRTMVPVEMIEKAFDCQVQVQDETVKVIPTTEFPIQQEHFTFGDKANATVELTLITNAGGWPDYWAISVDNREAARLDDEDGLYSKADMQLNDITGDGVPEILVSRYSSGTAGTQGLNIYSWDGQQLVSIFASPNWADVAGVEEMEKRYRVEYLGNFQVGFSDRESGKTAIIHINRGEFTAAEYLLSGISTWIDPISSYDLTDLGADGVCEIISDQRVIGVAHVHTLAHLRIVYELEQGSYQKRAIILQDEDGKILMESH